MNNTIQPQQNGDFRVIKMQPVIYCPTTKKPLTIDLENIKQDTAKNLEFWNDIKNNEPETFKGFESELRYWQEINNQLKKLNS